MQQHLASVGLLVDALDHDLRNAINVIKTADFYLRTRLGEADPRLLRQLELIDNGCNSAVKLLQDLIEYAHSPAPSLNPDTPLAAVNAAVQDCGPDRSRITVKCDADLTPVPMDSQYVKLAIRKLLQRAVHGSPAGAPLRVHIRQASGAVEIVVEDGAPTLPEAQREAFALASSGAAGHRPSNLPMALISEIVKLHGGSARCEPLMEGDTEGGSRMIITLYAAGHP